MAWGLAQSMCTLQVCSECWQGAACTCSPLGASLSSLSSVSIWEWDGKWWNICTQQLLCRIPPCILSWEWVPWEVSSTFWIIFFWENWCVGMLPRQGSRKDILGESLRNKGGIIGWYSWLKTEIFHSLRKPGILSFLLGCLDIILWFKRSCSWVSGVLLVGAFCVLSEADEYVCQNEEQPECIARSNLVSLWEAEAHKTFLNLFSL